MTFFTGDSLLEGLLHSPIFQSLAIVSQQEVKTHLKPSFLKLTLGFLNILTLALTQSYYFM
jgi:hypothetical protein